ncbi:MAG TPA: hypothetical protein VGN52_13385 [Burkholderiales bacterium]
MLANFIIFAILFTLGVYAPAWRTLWVQLVENYRDNGVGATLREASFSYQACRVGGIPAELFVEIRRSGLFLQLGWPCKWVAPPVLIPWQRLTLTNVIQESLLTRAQVELEVQDYPLRILIPGKAGSAVAASIRKRRT